MVTLVAALYVILPALYALACVALAMRPVRISEPASEAPSASNAVFRTVRDCAARRAVEAHAMAMRSSGVARSMWLDVAMMYRNRAEAYNASIVA